VGTDASFRLQVQVQVDVVSFGARFLIDGTLWGARRKDDDHGVASEGEDCSSGYRRCQCRREAERRFDDEGHEAEESPSHKGAVRARGEVPLEVQGVQRLSARSSALWVQGVRWVTDMRTRSSALYMQGVRWVRNLRARS
jgi:hypothetical protein